ncbi:MAG: gamma-glutamylcyclotransferase [Desulfuromonas sp.]|nr:MAG: gamma-glutamylcyclotransferase [Desulfuromonas sp.]
MPEKTYLFVYGTLRRAGGMERLLAGQALFVADGCFQGRLYRVADYPGAVPSEDPAELVRGEVYELVDAEAVLSRLDSYEECGPGFPEPAEYIRHQEEIHLADGHRCRAWIYLYNHPVADLPLIPSGDFLALP